MSMLINWLIPQQCWYRDRAWLLCLVWSASLIITETAAAELKLTLNSESASNTYVNGQPIRIVANHTGGYAERVSYHWQNYQGRALTEARAIDDDDATDIIPPTGDLPRYLGLVFTPLDPTFSLPGREPGEPDEYGFAVLPEPVSSLGDPNLWMGMVHANLDDPWLRGWSKTMTWKTTSAKWWPTEMEKRRAKGFVELPIITGSVWKSNDEEAVGTAQLAELRSKVTDYLSADPATLYWETGIEENLRGRFKTPYYFSNLDAKSDIVRSVADKTNPDIKLIFQIANMRYQDIGPFMASAASENYDILALHPYHWPDFPPVEEWLTEFLANVQTQMQQQGRKLPLWVTEIGAPHQGNAPGLFFGYPKNQKPVQGLSREAMVAYLVKLHVLSRFHGVDKVFWYNYRDRGASRAYAEDHFGLIDYWGYPKPAYPAYITLLDNLADKSADRLWQPGNSIQAYAFHSNDIDNSGVIVAWAYPAMETWLDFARLGLDNTAGVRITDALGGTVAFDGEKTRLTREPVYIHIDRYKK